MDEKTWFDNLPVEVVVCDAQGVLIAMNEQASLGCAKYGGKSLIGRHIAEFHPERAQPKIAALLADPRPDTRITERRGRPLLIHQSPWFVDGEYRGFMTIKMLLPDDIPPTLRRD